LSVRQQVETILLLGTGNARLESDNRLDIDRFPRAKPEESESDSCDHRDHARVCDLHLRRGSKLIVPRGATRITEWDVLTVVTSGSGESELRHRLTEQTPPA